MGSVCDSCSDGKGTWCLYCMRKEYEDSAEFLSNIFAPKKDEINISNINSPRVKSEGWQKY